MVSNFPPSPARLNPRARDYQELKPSVNNFDVRGLVVSTSLRECLLRWRRKFEVGIAVFEEM